MSNRKVDLPNVDFRWTVSPRQPWPPYFILVTYIKLHDPLANMGGGGVFILFFSLPSFFSTFTLLAEASFWEDF